MSHTEKKVIVFIVEGPSDEAALGTIMKRYFSNDYVHSLVVHGDITSGYHVEVNNIVKKINDLILDVKDKYRFRNNDFLRIIHLTDTDGVFIPDDRVKHKQSRSGSNILYFEDHMNAFNVEKTIERNHKKAQILSKLKQTKCIGKIPYRIYYNSCNLEHVLYNTLRDVSDEKKEEMSDDFAEKYEDNMDDFLSFISDPSFAVPGSYSETWKYIEKNLNSLNRHTNINQIFDIAQSPDPFFSDSNMDYVKKSVQELHDGKGTSHELIEVDDE